MPDDWLCLRANPKLAGNDPPLASWFSKSLNAARLVARPAQAAAVCLAVHRIHLLGTLETRPAPLAELILFNRIERPAVQFLHRQAVQVFAQPFMAQLRRIVLHGVFIEAYR